MCANHSVVPDKEYQAHLERAAGYIRDHYAEELSLDKLAAIAHYSKYHFHRLFHEHFGETVNDRVRRVRLEQAARRLINDFDASIDEVAASCGFSSAQYFAREFKSHFGHSPSSFRTGSGRENIASLSDDPGESTPLQVKIKELPPYRVAYIRVIGPDDSALHVQALKRLLTWADTNGLYNEQIQVIGAGWSDSEKSPSDPFVFDVCLVVSEDVQAEGEIGIQYFPGGPYAVLYCEDVLEANNRQGRRLYYEWMLANGYRMGDWPFLIFYGNDPEANPRKIAIWDICLPIRPL